MRRSITLISLMAMILGLLASSAIAEHRNPNLGFDPSNNVSVGDSVTITAFDTSTSGDVHIDECHVDGTRAASTACEDDGDGDWVNVASKNNTSATDPTTYAAPTDTAGVFGYRARSAHDSDVGDLTVEAATEGQRHNACNGIDKALEKSSANGKQKLQELANERFNCEN